MSRRHVDLCVQRGGVDVILKRVDFVFCFFLFFFFFSSRRRHTRCREVSWARRCVQETDVYHYFSILVSVLSELSIEKTLGMEMTTWRREFICLLAPKKFFFLRKRELIFSISSNEFCLQTFLLRKLDLLLSSGGEAGLVWVQEFA
eukprot:TRINITY_DN27419_c0_g1_i3.p3 TRINITY_DN27419_c0_g1~~TRINITY_DN27419_c0_g1_i3.p3  ORF type:complete len:146 (-),score=41.75 TRINITY_DN27419_c0_g1_i3:226-663(-)